MTKQLVTGLRRVNAPNGYPYQIIIIATKVTIKLIYTFQFEIRNDQRGIYHSIDIKRWKKKFDNNWGIKWDKQRTIVSRNEF